MKSAPFHANTLPAVAAAAGCHNAPVFLLMARGAFCLFREEFPLMYCFGDTEIKFVSKLSGEVFYDSTRVHEGSSASVMSHKDVGTMSFCVRYG